MHMFPISRDPPDGGTAHLPVVNSDTFMFPISRDPPEGGTQRYSYRSVRSASRFQFLGIPPKGERNGGKLEPKDLYQVSNF